MADRAAGYFWQAGLERRRTSLVCPEKPERCAVLMPERIFRAAGVAGRAETFAARGESILRPVHERVYIEKVKTAHRAGMRYLDAGETEVTADVFEQALWAASAGCEAVERVLAGEFLAAFCAVRPPGHHANRHRALGFCVFNNAAVAAAHALSHPGIDRVMVLDWDVHPGNGTMEIFLDDPAVFTLSIHQAGLFPESGREDIKGRGAGEGFHRNVVIPPGTPTPDYLARFEQALAESVDAFAPALLIVSAGFDAHYGDPASKLGLDADSFAQMTRLALQATAPHTAGRTVSILEGGYNLSALVDCVAAHYRVLCGA
ncbi:MAG: histone deacetylase [SAR324 cluster bacterium]|nr:histone deacetylase [SAR324 cluster bacterium]MCH8886451.1 histone deacetylase [SAR324 cluster bacterium]